MSAKKTSKAKYIFAGVVFLLVVLVYLDVQKSKENAGVGEYEQKLLSVSIADIKAIRLIKRSSTLEIKKDGNVFHMTQPVNDEVDDSSLINYLNSAADAKGQAITSKDGSIDWAKYGLVDGTKIEVETAKGTQGFTISNTNAYDGSFYVRKGDKLFIADRAFAHLAEKDAKSLRSRRLWRAQGEAIKVFYHVELPDQEPETAVFEKSDKGWTVKPEFDLPLVSERFEAWVQDVRELEARGVAADKLEGKADDFSLAKTSMSLEFTVRKDGKEAKSQWSIGRDKGEDVYAQTSARTDVYKMSQASLREIRVPLESFLNGKDTLKFPVEQAREVTLTIDGKTTSFKKGANDWTMSGPDASKFSPAALAGFFQRLQAMEPIVGVLPKDVKFQGEKNRLSIRSQDKLLLEVLFSDEKNQKRYLKTNRWKETLHTNNETLQALLKTNFTQAPDVKRQEPSK